MHVYWRINIINLYKNFVLSFHEPWKLECYLSFSFLFSFSLPLVLVYYKISFCISLDDICKK